MPVYFVCESRQKIVQIQTADTGDFAKGGDFADRFAHDRAFEAFKFGGQRNQKIFQKRVFFQQIVDLGIGIDIHGEISLILMQASGNRLFCCQRSIKKIHGEVNFVGYFPPTANQNYLAVPAGG